MLNNGNIDNEEKEDILEELSEYFSVLGNETRIKILKAIENEGKDARTIAGILRKKWDIEVAIPNTKKHLSRLIDIGIVTKYPVVRDDGQIVMCFERVSGSFDAVRNNLNILSGHLSSKTIVSIKEINKIDNVIKKILQEFPLDGPNSVIILMDGEKIKQTYPLEKKSIQIGRINPDKNDISLLDEDRTVGRNQSRIIFEYGKYYLEDNNSKNGTFIGGQQQDQFVKLKQAERRELNDGDVIRLGLLNTIFVFRRGKE